MSELLERAIAAHGGWERWQQVERVTAEISVDGAMWHLKGWPGALAQSRVAADTRRQRAVFTPFVETGRRGVFEPQRTAIVTDGGETIGQRDAPRRAFEGHALATPWDAQHLLYFSGYAMWVYLNAPFLFKAPGFRTEEVEPWIENGETWRRLRVVFPPEVHGHSPEQTFYFDDTGLLRRHDYSVDIMGGTSSAHYVAGHRAFGGLVFPTKRRVYATGPDNRPLLERVAVAIDVHDIEVA